jgi:hypothetical protein
MTEEKKIISDEIQKEQKATPLILTTTKIRKQIKETKKFFNDIKY